MILLTKLKAEKRRVTRMIKRKLQDLTACCAYQVNFLHAKEHDWREFRKQYEVLEEIGRGGFGVVYAGTRISDDASVAIKFIEHRHVREWTVAGSHLIPSEVSHLEVCGDVPGCIKLYDWFANSKGFVVIMERPKECCDMFDLVSRYGKLDEDTARSIFLQVVETVYQMFARHGLIHRDIKDENIIICMDTGVVRLVDFGATAAAEKAVKKEFQGTRSYCPPEWFRMLQYLPLEATSWSLGVLLYILVTGTLPFKNEVQACLGSVNFPSFLSKEICQLIKRCLCTVPSQRATLLEIRGHSWMSRPLPEFEGSFQDDLDRKLSPKSKKPLNRDESVEENRLLDDIILVSEDQGAESSRMRRESTEYLEAYTSMPRLNASSDGLSRLASKYDNVSASSLADYYSLSSFATANESFSNLLDDDLTSPDDVSETSSRLTKARSLSAYSLSRRRRSLLPRSSFERELDTVEETDGIFFDDPSAHLLTAETTFVPSISASFSLPPPSTSTSFSNSISRDRWPSPDSNLGYVNDDFYHDASPSFSDDVLVSPPSPAPEWPSPWQDPVRQPPPSPATLSPVASHRLPPPAPSSPKLRPRFSLDMDAPAVRVISRMRPLFVSEAPPALQVFAAAPH